MTEEAKQNGTATTPTPLSVDDVERETFEQLTAALTEERTIELPADDAAMVQKAWRRICQVGVALLREEERHAAEMDRHQAAKSTILDEAATAQTLYEQVVEMIAQKHIPNPGRFDFLPDKNAFVGRVPKQGDQK
jgi:hypothetical protein